MSKADICFLATAKSGLGHLRRVATIAGRLRKVAPERRLHLITNARPEGVSAEDLSVFAEVRIAERAAMAAALPVSGPLVVVLDTITVPGIEALGAPLALILRETPEERLGRFRLEAGRQWDAVLIANPAEHWLPSATAMAARSVTPVGWIYRPTGPRLVRRDGPTQVLVATGGGGTAETSAALYAEIDAVLALARQEGALFEVVQAIGPRARGFGQLAGADRNIDPGPDLNDLFRAADVVISTAGYNSVLELATTDTPSLLVPIPRSIDDQAGRAQAWADRLGTWLDASDPGRSARWLVEAVTAGRRRPAVDLGPSGEDAAARAILALE